MRRDGGGISPLSMITGNRQVKKSLEKMREKKRREQSTRNRKNRKMKVYRASSFGLGCGVVWCMY